DADRRRRARRVPRVRRRWPEGRPLRAPLSRRRRRAEGVDHARERRRVGNDAAAARRVMMRLYSALTRSEEPFAPATDNAVRMYTCGLTVYARGHIGNFRTFVCTDVLRRTLKYLLGYDVRQVMNFTDVDDRTIAGAQKAGMELRAYTERYIAMFREGAASLGLERVEESPRATAEANTETTADLIRAR